MLQHTTQQLSQDELKFAILATDVVVFSVREGELKVLLLTVNVPPYYVDAWGVPGGLILPSETAEDSVVRHMEAKAGIVRAPIEQLYSFSAVDRDPRGRVVSIAYYALIPETYYSERLSEKLDAGQVRWVSAFAVPSLAYDHNDIVRNAVERLQAKLGYTTIVQGLLPRVFTLSELQSIYEVVLNRPLDKRNFRKKVLVLGILKETGHERRDGAHRPAALYTFRKQSVEVLPIL